VHGFVIFLVDFLAVGAFSCPPPASQQTENSRELSFHSFNTFCDDAASDDAGRQ
jgi:hypothetical protein